MIRQRREERQQGTLYILTGPAGAGKSHLAASARPKGTLWILDTECAVQNLYGKPGIHHNIQTLQTLSLGALIQALRVIERQARSGDTIILDSLSKAFQATRATLFARRQDDIDHSLEMDIGTQATLSRMLRALDRSLIELAQKGFDLIVIGHMARLHHAGRYGIEDDG